MMWLILSVQTLLASLEQESVFQDAKTKFDAEGAKISSFYASRLADLTVWDSPNFLLHEAAIPLGEGSVVTFSTDGKSSRRDSNAFMLVNFYVGDREALKNEEACYLGNGDFPELHTDSEFDPGRFVTWEMQRDRNTWKISDICKPFIIKRPLAEPSSTRTSAGRFENLLYPPPPRDYSTVSTELPSQLELVTEFRAVCVNDTAQYPNMEVSMNKEESELSFAEAVELRGDLKKFAYSLTDEMAKAIMEKLTQVDNANQGGTSV
jgi:hypothetical protein